MSEEEKEDEIAEDEEIKSSLLKKSEISILLDTYDDIFSDFDPRPYPQRALSDDFLLEAKKATMARSGAFQLRFMIPHHKRKLDHEVLVKKRLREHFRKHALLLEAEVARTKSQGWKMAIAGALMLVLAMLISVYGEEHLWTHALLVLLEPAGWFTAWTGLDEVYYTARAKKPDLEFYQKMMNVEILFISY